MPTYADAKGLNLPFTWVSALWTVSLTFCCPVTCNLGPAMCLWLVRALFEIVNRLACGLSSKLPAEVSEVVLPVIPARRVVWG